MIFLKNILKKSNIKWYFISLFIIIFSLATLTILYNKLKDDFNLLCNEIVYRTVIIDSNVKIEEREYIESIVYDDTDDTTIVILKDYSDVKQFIKNFDKNINFTFHSLADENQILYYCLVFVLVILYIGLLLIFCIYIFQFITDDISTIKILRAIGYSKNDIILRYYFSFFLVFNIVYLISMITSLLINAVFMSLVNYQFIFAFILILYVFFSIYLFFITFIRITILSKRKLSRILE